MATRLVPNLRTRYFDSNGKPLVGGMLYSYVAGTTTPLATYTDSSGSTPNANPIVLDASGEADVWIGASNYKFVLKDSLGVVQWTEDNVSGNSSAAANGIPVGGTTGQVLTKADATDFNASWITPTAAAGTVTSASVVSANGLAGTVVNPTTTPAITLTTTVTGLLKGNGTAISAASPGTDFLAATSGSAVQKANGSGGLTAATAKTDYWDTTDVVGDSGSGGTHGLVPAPGAGTAAAGKFLKADGTWSVPAGGGTGTVTSVSVVTANGLNGSVATATTTPAITLGTSVTGLVKGNGTALSAATAKTDYWDTTDMTGDAGSGGTHGLVPAPGAGTAAAGKFLKADGTWAVPASGSTSPLTTKGDLYGFDTAGNRIPVGANTYVLTADSTAALGVKWAAPSGGGATAMAVLTKAAAYTILTTDFSGYRLMVLANFSTAATLTLPAASNSGYEVNVINIGSATCTIATAGSDTFGSNAGDNTWTLIPGGSPQASNTFISSGGTIWAGF